MGVVDDVPGSVHVVTGISLFIARETWASFISGFGEGVLDVAVVEGKLPLFRPHRHKQVSRVDQQDRVEHERVGVCAGGVSRLT